MMGLKKGMFITVTQWKSKNDGSWVGNTLEVLAVSGDNVWVKNHGGSVDEHNIHLSEVDIHVLSDDYVAAHLDYLKRRAEKYQDTPEPDSF